DAYAERPTAVPLGGCNDATLAAVLAAGDALVVVAQRPGAAGGLADRVASGVQRDRAGRVAVAGVGLLGRAVDLQVEAAGVGVGRQLLDHGQRSRLADVGDRADDRVAVADVDVQRRVVRPIGARHDAVAVLADD